MWTTPSASVSCPGTRRAIGPSPHSRIWPEPVRSQKCGLPHRSNGACNSSASAEGKHHYGARLTYKSGEPVCFTTSPLRIMNVEPHASVLELPEPRPQALLDAEHATLRFFLDHTYDLFPRGSTPDFSYFICAPPAAAPPSASISVLTFTASADGARDQKLSVQLPADHGCVVGDVVRARLRMSDFYTLYCSSGGVDIVAEDIVKVKEM